MIEEKDTLFHQNTSLSEHVIYKVKCTCNNYVCVFCYINRIPCTCNGTIDTYKSDPSNPHNNILLWNKKKQLTSEYILSYFNDKCVLSLYFYSACLLRLNRVDEIDVDRLKSHNHPLMTALLILVNIEKRNEPEIIRLLKELGELNSSTSLFQLSRIYMRKEQYQLSNEYLIKAEKLNDINAIIELAIRKLNGTHIAKDLSHVFELLKSALNHDFYGKLNQEQKTKVRITLAYLYKYNFIDYRKSFELFRQLADEKNHNSMIELADLFNKGNGCEKSVQEAINLLYSIKDTNKLAKLKLGLLYKENNSEKDAKNLFKELHDVNYLDGSFQYALILEKYKTKQYEFKRIINTLTVNNHKDASFYMYNECVKLNNPLANNYLLRAAKGGHSIAKQILGIQYMNDKKYADAYNMLKDLKTKEAYYNLGFMYSHGLHVEKNLYKSIEYYEKAKTLQCRRSVDRLIEIYKETDREEYNNLCMNLADEGIPEYQFIVAEKYKKDKKIKEAVEMYRKAGEQGHLKSQYILGLYYECKQENENALLWYQEAAKQGYHNAYFKTALMCINTDTKKAVQYLSQSNNITALFMLASVYHNGKNEIKADLSLALKYYTDFITDTRSNGKLKKSALKRIITICDKIRIEVDTSSDEEYVVKRIKLS
jgi:TPR repeat protein